MPQTVSVRVEGLRELGERMRGLSADINRKIARAATNAGAQVIKKLAISKAPVSDPSVTPEEAPGFNIKKNIIVRYKRRSIYTSEHVVTVRRGKGKLRVDPYAVARFQEFGTVHHSPQPFLRPAFDSGKMRAVEAIKQRLRQRIEKAEKTGK